MTTSTAPIIEMHITGERLMAMYDNDMDVYATPGASEAYWASRPNFMYDKVVRTAQEIIDDICADYGMDEDELRADETPYTFLVELIEAL
jgi:hypothetical protein